ncbi:leucine-rich repeat-containing protein kinase family protein [Shewanella sp. 10N.286.54.B9]|uniref:leucine-rich repeat-containing protein kinase family protein n=1 Tax=Shewanella sp. 10N.286.54.B9 TaxID=3229719 RepID=UPI00354ADF82
MHTLAQLASGELKGIKRLTISEELTAFPDAIFTLADTLEVLDLSGNKLSQLPSNFSSLTKLKLLFLTSNEFEQVPAVIAASPQLEMISFKSNKLKTVATGSLPVRTRWLILTDNQITSLPEDMGSLTRLQKLALAGNKLSALPISMANCSNLELARLSANEFTQFPDWLFQLPKLAWLAVAGNPTAADNKVSLAKTQPAEPMQSVPLADIQLGQVIGQGASGVIYSAKWLNQPQSLKGTAANIAVKLFKGEVTSDGYPSDELACCLQAGVQNNLIKVVAQIKDAGKLGLVMELIPSSFANLGLPPSLDTCTRDTFVKGQELSLEQVLLVLMQMAAAMAHLHKNGVSHGDVYAHNTMINSQADMLFGDFGAASNLLRLPLLQREAMESIEVRALGCLIEDLLDNRLAQRTELSEIVIKLELLAEDCLQTRSALRPRFSEVLSQLKTLQDKRLNLASYSEK